MKVSVIIPTYNRAYILPDAIESVLRQTYANFELIVVNDGSTDETAPVVERVADSRIRFLQHGNNRGYSAALNTGLAAATGDLIAFIDSDDLWRQGKLEAQVAFLQDQPGIGGVFSDLEWVTPETQTISMLSAFPIFAGLLSAAQNRRATVFPQRSLYLCMLEEMPVKLIATMLRRDCVQKLSGFEESWKSGPDWEFLLRFTKQNALGYVNRSLTVQRRMADSTLGRHQKMDAACLMERFIREKEELSNDLEALAAVKRGIAHHAKELGWQYLNEGDKTNAMKTYWRGFNESGDPKFLARVAAAPLPTGLRDLVKRLRGVSAA